MAPMPAEVIAGAVLDGKYILQAPLGGGRFGTVYRALHIALQKPVAIKLLHAAHLSARDFEQFRVEAEALGRLAHPHIVGVIDFGVDPHGAGTPYLVMELVAGQTLDEIVARGGPIDLVRAAPWLQQVAAALEHAHASGVVHGDLSARNVIVDGTGDATSVKVIDFGLARLVAPGAPPAPPDDAGDSASALSPRLAGTPPYMAPEHLRGDPPTPPGDVYALGVLASVVLTGRAPFEGDARAIMQQKLTSEAPPLSSLYSDLPTEIDEAFASALARTAATRPSASMLAGQLVASARHLVRRRWRRREAPRRLALAMGVSVLLAWLGAWVAAQPAVARLDGAAADAQFALAPALTADPRLLLVSLDDASLAGDATPLSSRAGEFATIAFDTLEAGASVVAFDLLLPEAWAADPRFGDLLLTHAPRLVLGMVSDGATVVGPEAIDPLVAGALGPEAASALLGLVSHVAAPDGVVRRARARVVDREGRARPTLAGRIADIVHPTIGAAAGAAPFVVDFRLDASRIERKAWRRFAEDVSRGTRFDNQIVIVGAEFTGSGDRHRVPGPGRLSSEVSGLSLQGVITHTLLQDRPIADTPPGWVWFGTVVVLLAAVITIVWVRRLLTAAVICVGIIVAGLSVAQAALLVGYLSPLGAPALLWLVACGAALVLRSRLPAPPE